MKRNWFRKILGAISLTSVLFVFQACYGTPQDYGLDVLVEGQVLSGTTGLPIEGIKVSVADNIQYEFTNSSGMFSFYAEKHNQITLKFEDIDLAQNSSFANRNTLLSNASDEVYLNIVMDEN